VPNIRQHVIVKGRVQGVWFRASMQEQALQYGVTGWVRNLQNGNVEAIFEGDDETVQQLILWCHQGPSLARVDQVIVTQEKYIGEFYTFSKK